MITPLMHILSCLNSQYAIGAPVDILYLNKQDRNLIISEACRLGSILTEGEDIWVAPSPTGIDMVCQTQVINNEAKTLNPYTALLLTRVKNCFPKYYQEVDSTKVESSDEDLSTDAVVLRLEGSPRYIYMYVYNVMEMPSLSYDARIEKLRELLLTIQSHVAVVEDVEASATLTSRLELQSKLSYWKGMLLADYITYFGSLPEEFSDGTIATVRKELQDLGFYGFVNPLKMYQDFSGSRVSRKVQVNIEDWVVAYLTKVVLSGGATLE